ncbi:hypothetical protein HZF08_03040 [Paenibacillus sp. CGMCC 1.16610]|uniref:Uncharacterized protein n=1 Tax=Paenibacillus anseongense TaxID=2682845 RepID=A0ABW9UA49_9BACL|nr:MULTISPECIES: hypothetical protein [Paenibacillus]MBA2937267.1 hypothetical protein [Paenibacillus sp. CGMCC 1.16610]MVQ36326.1 hypothetical protein [Paenibacillus anseongense]
MAQEQTKRYSHLMHSIPSNSSIEYPLNPWIPLWWSAAFPGYGHCMVNYPLIGYSLIIFEFTVNNLAKVNKAIYFSMLGDFQSAIDVIDLRFFYLYIGVYVFTMFDSYRRCVDMNNNYVLSYRTTTLTKTTKASSFSVNTLNKVSPITSTYWEMIMPGLGSLYLNHLISFFFSIITWVITIGFSRFYVGVYYTCIGNFEKAKTILDPQWYLFIPSIYGGYVYFAYSQAVITNFQFKLSQSQFLRSEYQHATFDMPLPVMPGGNRMYIIASFEHSTAIELALTELEQIGVEKSDMFALPLRVRNEKKKLFDNAHYSDGVSFVDLATILGSICMLLGGIYGFVLKQGPILWALYGLVVGGVLGFLIKFIVIKKMPSLDLFGRRKATEIVMMIRCGSTNDDQIKKILWNNKALGLTEYDPNKREME